MRIKKIVVTGSSGTIGTRLCETLLEKGYDVVGVDRVPNKWSKAVSRITVVGNLLKSKTFDDIPRDAHLFMHLAANVRIYNSVLDPELARENIQTTFNSLEFCRNNRIKKFFFASSREVYGNIEDIVRSEDKLRVENCESPYTASKISGEALAQAYMRCYKIDFVIVRFSNVYGMYDESDRLIPVFIKLTNEGKDLVVYGKEKELDFTYIDDAVSGVVSAVENFHKVKNDIYNIASGKATQLVDVAKIVQKRMGGKGKIHVEHNRTGEVVRYQADIKKASDVLGYKPSVDIEEGIGRSVEWYTKKLYH